MLARSHRRDTRTTRSASSAWEPRPDFDSRYSRCSCPPRTANLRSTPRNAASTLRALVFEAEDHPEVAPLALGVIRRDEEFKDAFALWSLLPEQIGLFEPQGGFDDFPSSDRTARPSSSVASTRSSGGGGAPLRPNSGGS